MASERQQRRRRWPAETCVASSLSSWPPGGGPAHPLLARAPHQVVAHAQHVDLVDHHESETTVEADVLGAVGFEIAGSARAIELVRVLLHETLPDPGALRLGSDTDRAQMRVGRLRIALRPGGEPHVDFHGGDTPETGQHARHMADLFHHGELAERRVDPVNQTDDALAVERDEHPALHRAERGVKEGFVAGEPIGAEHRHVHRVGDEGACQHARRLLVHAGSVRFNTSEPTVERSHPVYLARCLEDCSFSLQMNSIISVSNMMRWFTRTVNGLVYALGSSMVMSICMVPKFGRRKRSVILSASVYGLPFTSSHPARSSPRKLVVSTTSVSLPSHQPRE